MNVSRPKKMLIVLILVVFSNNLFAAVITEKDAVVIALQSNTSIRLEYVAGAGDSLSRALVKTAFLPAATTTASALYTPYDSSSILGSNTASTGISADIAASQRIPGGGVASVSAVTSRTNQLDTALHVVATSMSAGFSQPLLKGAWQYGEKDYAVRISNLEYSRLSLEHKKKILSTLSDVRQKYWACYEAQLLVSTFRGEMDYAQQRLKSERVKFSSGDGAAVDTLSALLSYLQSLESFTTSQNAAARALRAFSLAMGASADSFTIDTTGNVVITNLPPVEEFLASVKEYDPQTRIYEVLRQRFLQQEARDRNAMLPQLDVQGSYSREVTGSSFANSSIAFKSNAVVALVLSYDFPAAPRKITLMQTSLQKKSNELALEEYLRSQNNLVTDIYRTWDEERQALLIAQTSRDIALLQRDAIRKGYELGSRDRLALDKAETDYVSAAIRCIQKQIALKKIEITFDELTGKVFTVFGVSLQ
jgi:outer membrane protein TolC